MVAFTLFVMRFGRIIRRIHLFRFIFDKWRGTAISVHKTLLVNFLLFRIKDALKLPIWVYQGTRIEHIGKVQINAPLHSGMIRFGRRKFFRSGKTVIINNGVITFQGNCTIMGGTTVHVLGTNCQMQFGRDVMIGENVKILVGPDISIGDFTRIAFGCVLMSADFHYVLNTSNGKVHRSMAPIVIGKYNWIGNNCSIKKGVVTSDYCIVSNNSLLLKDYSTDLPYPFIAGVPGKIKGYGLRRIYNDKSSKELDLFFENDGGDSMTIPLKEDDPDFNWYCNGKINVHLH